MGRDEGREDVVAAVAGTAVAVLPAVVRGEERVERGEQVVVTAGARFDDRDSGGGVGDEDIEEAVTAGGRLRRKASQSRVRSMTLSVEPVATFSTRVVKASGMPPSWPMARASQLDAASPADTSGPLDDTPRTAHRRPGHSRRPRHRPARPRPRPGLRLGKIHDLDAVSRNVNNLVEVEVVVIGAGQAGLSSAYHLRRTGFEPERDFVVLDHSPVRAARGSSDGRH